MRGFVVDVWSFYNGPKLLEKLVENKRMDYVVNNPESNLGELMWTGTSNKSTDWDNLKENWGFELTTNNKSTILSHQNRESVDVVITYDSFQNDEIKDIVSRMNEQSNDTSKI